MTTKRTIDLKDIQILIKASSNFNYVSESETPIKTITLNQLSYAKIKDTGEQIAVIEDSKENGDKFKIISKEILENLFFNNSSMKINKAAVKYFNNRFYSPLEDELVCIIPDKLASKPPISLDLDTILKNEQKVFASSIKDVFNVDYKKYKYKTLEVLRINRLLSIDISELQKNIDRNDFLQKRALQTNIGLNEMMEVFTMAPLFVHSLLDEENLENNNSNTEYSEKSEVFSDLENKMRKCGSATLYNTRDEFGLEDDNLPPFNIFIHLGKIMREFESLRESLRKKQMTTSKSVSFDLNEQDNFRQQESKQQYQQQQQQSLSTIKPDIVLPNKTKQSISTSDDKVSTSTTTINTSNVKTAVIIPSSTPSISTNSTTKITSTTNSIKVPPKSNLKKPSIIQKTLAKTSTTIPKTTNNSTSKTTSKKRKNKNDSSSSSSSSSSSDDDEDKEEDEDEKDNDEESSENSGEESSEKNQKDSSEEEEEEEKEEESSEKPIKKKKIDIKKNGKLDNFVKSKSNSSTTLQPTNNAIVVVKKDKKDKKRKFEQSKVNVKSNNDKEESSSSSSSDDESSNISPLQKKIRLVYKTAVKNNKQDHDNDFLLNNFGDINEINKNDSLKKIFNRVILPFYSIMTRQYNSAEFRKIRRKNDLKSAKELALALD